MEAVLGIGLVVLLALGVVVFVLSSLRRSERERRRWQSRRGVDTDPADHDDGARRSHWGGMGRPGGR